MDTYIEEIKYVNEDTIHNLEVAVNELLEEGWMIEGRIQYNRDYKFIQTMVKRVEMEL